MPDIPLYEASNETLQQMAQAYLEVRKMARSIENTAMSFIPLTDNEKITELLTQLDSSAKLCSAIATQLYQQIARKALGNA